MKFGVITYSAVLFGAGLVAAALAAARPVPGPGGEDPAAAVWADPEAVARTVALDAERGAVVSRIEEKEALAAALVRGERTLDDVADRFAELNGPAPVLLLPGPSHDRAASAEELAYHEVVGYVRSLSKDNRAAAVLPGLEAEVSRRFPHPGADPAT
jgi:hypothetical protein